MAEPSLFPAPAFLVAPMSTPSLPPSLSGGLYLVAGVLFVAGAVSSRHYAFGGVGVAFIALGVAMIVRARRQQD